MPYGLQWIRHRQRALTRVVIALFVLAWLQAAAVPCAMAAGAATPAVAAHAAMHHDCRYCPHAPDRALAGSSPQDGCAFPHEPQAASPDGNVLHLAVAPSAPLALIGVDSGPLHPVALLAMAAVARPPILDSYCRRIE